MVGLIAVTAFDLARNTAERSPDWWVSGAIFAVALVVLYLWKSKMAAPALLAAAGGALLLS